MATLPLVGKVPLQQGRRQLVLGGGVGGCSAWVLCWVHSFWFFGGALFGGGVLDGCGRILALGA